MEKPEKYSWLDEYLTALEKAVWSMDLSTLQPTSWQHFQPLIAKEWLEWFEGIVKEREKKGVSFETLARSFEPDLCREHLLFVLEDLKSARWPLEKRFAMSDFFYQLLKAQMPQGDLFGLNGSTRRHGKKEIAEIMKLDFEQGSPVIARELGKLYNGGYNLGAAIYLDFYMGKAVENWGPYELPDGKILVIKELRFLRPLEIWPDIKTSCDKIDIYAVYEGVKFATDLIACHSYYTGDTINGLKQWRMEIDGQPVKDIETVKKTGLNLGETGSTQWTNLIKLPEQELLQKAVWIRCYCFKGICDTLGLDWKPTQKLLDAVKGKTLAQGWNTWKQPEDREKFEAYWKKIWDPREEFYP